MLHALPLILVLLAAAVVVVVLCRLVRLPPVLDALSTGQLVPWTEVGRLLLTQGLLISLVLGAAAAAVLRRRELAIAE